MADDAKPLQVHMDVGFLIFTIIALLGTQAILSDLHMRAPRVLHSVPFKLLAVYSALYMTTRSHALTGKAFVIFLLMYWVIYEFEQHCEILFGDHDELANV